MGVLSIRLSCLLENKKFPVYVFIDEEHLGPERVPGDAGHTTWVWGLAEDDEGKVGAGVLQGEFEFSRERLGSRACKTSGSRYFWLGFWEEPVAEDR